MSYAGNIARGRHAAFLDEPTPGAEEVRSRAASARLFPKTSAPRTVRTAEPDTEIDWQRVAIFASGTLLGIAVGVGAALLFAPQSGEEARRDLVRSARRVRARTADAWEDLRDEMRLAAHRGRRKLARRFRERRERREEHEADA
jgi:hypothetical protein